MAADKRSLYHLAPTQTPPPRIRRTLVQGRLASPASFNQPNPSLQPPSAFHGSYGQDQSPPVRVSRESTMRNTMPAIEAIGKSITPSIKMSMDQGGKEKDTTQESPRRSHPTQYSVPGQDFPVVSPLAAHPSSSLSLSDNDEDTHTRPSRHPEPQKLKHSQNSPVLMANASGRHKGPDRMEVPVVTSVVTSPVKVVCHSPRREREETVSLVHGVHVTGHTDSVMGHTDSARRVEVAGVKRINMSSKKDKTSLRTEAFVASLSEDSLDEVHDVPTIAGSPVDPQTTAVRVALDDNDKENGGQVPTSDHHQYKSFLGDVDEAGPLSAAMNSSNVRQQLFDYSVASVDCSLAVDPTSVSQMSVAGDEGARKKKKKSKPRWIPSRYMDSRKASKSIDKKSTSLDSKRKVSFTTANMSRALSLHDSRQLDATVPFQQHNTKGNKVVTSTPAAGSIGVLPGPPGGEMPAPTPILPPGSAAVDGRLGKHAESQSVAEHVQGISSKMLSGGLLYEKTKRLHKMKAPIASQISNPGPILKPGQEFGHGEVSQRQLELEYARLMQMIFLESKLKSTYKKQEKDAQAQMYSMWQENEKLQRGVAELQLELDTKNKMAELDKELSSQLSGLQATGGNIPKLILEYAQLSSALDTTRQYMPVSGVLLPDNHEELLKALDESEHLLGDIESLTRQQTHKVSNFSKEMTTIAKVADAEVQEHARCQELLAAATTLATQERSLQAHIMQDK